MMTLDLIGTAFVLWLTWSLFLRDIVEEVIKMVCKYKAKYKAEYSKGK